LDAFGVQRALGVVLEKDRKQFKCKLFARLLERPRRGLGTWQTTCSDPWCERSAKSDGGSAFCEVLAEQR
jgi:hypothetical protein